MAGCDRRAAAGSTVLEHHDAIDRQARRRFSWRGPRARAGSGSTGSCGGTCAQRRDRGRGPRSPRRWSSGWSARWCMRVAALTRFARRPRVWSAWRHRAARPLGALRRNSRLGAKVRVKVAKTSISIAYAHIHRHLAAWEDTQIHRQMGPRWRNEDHHAHHRHRGQQRHR